MNKTLVFLDKINFVHVFVLFILVHLFYFNVNLAEWGDSYRIMRAAEQIRLEGSYPLDEKRPPMFSVLLSFRPENLDPLFWSRLNMFFISSLGFVLSHFLFKKLSDDNRVIQLSLLLLLFNPVYLYWSIRVMADVPFSVVAIGTFLIFFTLNDKLTLLKTVALGFLCSFAIQLRFEGYILFGSVLIGLLLYGGNISSILSTAVSDFRGIILLIKSNTLRTVLFLLSFFGVSWQYILVRNPFVSTYLEEPGRRTYDLDVFLVYVLSLVFLFGIFSVIIQLFFNRNWVLNFFNENIPLTIFVVAELGLALVWPAAIPRLFVAIIPFLVFVVAKSIIDVELSYNFRALLFSVPLFIGYVLSQYFFRLQFLVVKKEFIAAVLIVNFFGILSLYFGRKATFIFLSIVSVVLWSGTNIWIHKDIFKNVVLAGEYAVTNTNGLVLHNDVSAVTNWYLNYGYPDDDVYGVYFNEARLDALPALFKDYSQAKYLIVTNEHNPTYTFDYSQDTHLIELVYESESNVNGRVFWTRVFKVL